MIARWCTLALCGVVACSHDPDYSQTHFKCDGTHGCPEGQECRQGACGPPCYGTGIVTACPVISIPVSLEAGRLDTDRDAMCEDFMFGETSACLIAGAGITVSGTVRAIGSRPLLLVSTETILVDTGAAIEASSRRGDGLQGAGADSSMCKPGIDPTTANGSSGGGWGGSFSAFGGDGSPGSAGSGGAAGQMGTPITAPFMLGGGCPGSEGGGAGSGAKGHGGGAVFLISSIRIVIKGRISASGSSGGGASAGANAGGGGGGSGGMIGLDAPTIDLNGGLLIANGSGGGEGGDSSNSGNDGMEMNGTVAASLGGFGGSAIGGDGGMGSSLQNRLGSDARPSTLSGGGGGGGGSAGVILIYGSASPVGGNVSPAPS